MHTKEYANTSQDAAVTPSPLNVGPLLSSRPTDQLCSPVCQLTGTVSFLCLFHFSAHPLIQVWSFKFDWKKKQLENRGDSATFELWQIHPDSRRRIAEALPLVRPPSASWSPFESRCMVKSAITSAYMYGDTAVHLQHRCSLAPASAVVARPPTDYIIDRCAPAAPRLRDYTRHYHRMCILGPTRYAPFVRTGVPNYISSLNRFDFSNVIRL